MNSKRIIIIASIVAILVVVGVVVAVVATRNDDDKDDVPMGGTVRERVMRVLDKSPIIDGHNDLPWQYQSYQNQIAKVIMKFLFNYRRNMVHSGIPSNPVR